MKKFKQVSLLRAYFLVFVKRGSDFFPFMGICIPKKETIIVEYYMIGEHLTFHLTRKPFLKHQRENYNKKNLFEREISLSDKNSYEFIEGYGISKEYFDPKLSKTFTFEQIQRLEEKKKTIRIINSDELSKFGYFQKGGLEFMGVVLPHFTDNKKEINNLFKRYFPTRKVIHREVCEFPDKYLLLNFYEDESLSSLGKKICVSQRIDQMSNKTNKELILKMFPKTWRDNIVIKNNGWTDLKEDARGVKIRDVIFCIYYQPAK